MGTVLDSFDDIDDTQDEDFESYSTTSHLESTKITPDTQ